MIEFQHKLPTMYADGKLCGTYNNRELGFPSILTTSDSELGLFLHRMRTNIYADRSLVFVDGKILVTDKNWIRDHVHVMKAMRHWEHDLASFLNFIIDTQREDGQYYEMLKQLDDRHWSFVNEDCYVVYPDDNLALIRLELEADIEYLIVEGAVYLYKTTGDDEWLSRVLPKLEKGINYITSDPKRWDERLGLVKRPFTIDTWDFTPLPDSHDNRRIEAHTPMSVMHGDNSGVYAAMRELAWLNRRLGNESAAEGWEARAEALRENIFKHLWNGTFFIHQLHLGHDGTSYFLYYPDSKPQPHGGPSAWGAAAFISAVDEGLAGIVDAGVNYDEILFSPKFPVTHYTELRYLTGYEVSGALVDVRYILTDEGMRYDIHSPARKITARFLLPVGRRCEKLLADGKEVPFSVEAVGDSLYVNADALAGGNIRFEILFSEG